MHETIALGDSRFQIRPLKLGQLRHLLDALDEMAGRSGGGLIEAAAKVVAAGIAPSHPEMTAERVLDLEAGVDDLNRAVAAILAVAGLRPQEQFSDAADAGENGARENGARENGLGEAPPVAGRETARADSSAPSTALSPPVAATPTR